MAMYALHALGWIAVERRIGLAATGQGAGALRSEMPLRLTLDPHAVEPRGLAALEALCRDWAEAPGTLTLVHWDGLSWFGEFGSPEQLAARARHLTTAKLSARFPSSIQSIVIPPDRFLRRLDPMFEKTLDLYQSTDGKLDGKSVFLKRLREAGVMEARVKCMVPDENNELRITAYSEGPIELWNADAHRDFVGRRILDLPDRHLGRRVQDDLLTAARRDDPVAHTCQGLIRTDQGLTDMTWTRFTLPLGDVKASSQRELLSLCLIQNLAAPGAA